MASKAQKRRQRQTRNQTMRSMYQQFRTEAGSVEQRKEREPDPRVVVLSARIRAGATNADDASRPIWGEPAGQAIAMTCDTDEARRLWDTFKRVDAADDAYARRYCGIRRFPNVGKLEYLPETLETRPDDRPDSRTQDEKDRDAVNEWMRWQGLFGRIGRDNHTAVVDAMRQRARLVHAGRVTKSGAAFIAAMRALDDQYQRR